MITMKLKPPENINDYDWVSWVIDRFSWTFPVSILIAVAIGIFLGMLVTGKI